MLGTALVRRLSDAQTVGRLWRQAQGASGELACPACCEPMAEVAHAPTASAGAAPELALDVCRRCHVFWFDAGEDAALAAAVAPPQAPEAPRPDPERIAKALVTVTGPAQDEPGRSLDFGIKNPWQRLAHHLGAPIAHDGAEHWLPVTTLSYALALLVGTLVSSTIPEAAHHLGLSAEAPLRLGGLPWLVAPLLERGLLAGLVNLFFFVFLADNLEQFLGSLRLLLLIVVASLAGSAAHVAYDPTTGAPLIGSDTVITALSVFFGLTFFRVRLDFLLGLYRPWHLFSIPAWAIIGGWTLLSILEAFAGASATTFGAHLGAACVALVAKWAFSDRGPTLAR
ncbi:MAG: rhomboid family intramembrane serine protease [Myxococcales bacterium]|nr:rhomboid family intramembrane serine protease [Myxococcales bacterium]